MASVEWLARWSIIFVNLYFLHNGFSFTIWRHEWRVLSLETMMSFFCSYSFLLLFWLSHVCAAITDTSALGDLHLDDLRLSNSERFWMKGSKTLTRSQRLTAVDVYHELGQIFSLLTFLSFSFRLGCFLFGCTNFERGVVETLDGPWMKPYRIPWSAHKWQGSVSVDGYLFVSLASMAQWYDLAGWYWILYYPLLIIDCLI